MKIDLKKFDFESNKILSSLSEKSRSIISAKSEHLKFKKGKLIFYEQGIPTGTFLIKKGRAKIFKTGLDGKDQIFYVYKEGDLLGYHALLCNESYEDSCEALEDCEIDFISKTNFDRLVDDIPQLKQLLIQNMSHEFGVLVNTITVLAQKPLRERLALWLLILNEKYYEEEIQLPREDLANLIGTARESLGRLLKDFKEEKLISIEGRFIRCTHTSKLLRIASSEYA
ncbi:Crp/Fnr family transcriptional regulator [Reichenbachiella sp.]|uniref:Crp/Fnr family transcriptional regulator n=1 Tax=Reichenbachiella sp. TaxID=2184521 RepID=UPI0032970CFF